MLLQIVVIFRVSLQFTCLFGAFIGFQPIFPSSPFFLLHFSTEVTSEVRKKKRKEKREVFKQKVHLLNLNNDPRMKSISMKTTSICSKMVQKVSN